MDRDTAFTPESTTLKTVETVRASFVAVSTFRASCVALFDS